MNKNMLGTFTECKSHQLLTITFWHNKYTTEAACKGIIVWKTIPEEKAIMHFISTYVN